MKLIGSYTSPFVRKISVILLEKRIPFEFVNESPYSESNGVARYNPLGKVPALVTDDGECWFDSPVIAQYLELLGVAPPMIPADPRAALRMRQLEALADGVMEAAQALVREKARPGVLPVMAPVRERLPLANLFPRLIEHLAQLRHHLRMAVLRQQGRKSGVA